jgi:hypothetical protein
MGRRGSGEGSIYRRKDGRWVGVADLGYVEGRRRRKSYYGTTRGAVQKKLASAVRDLSRGRFPADIDRVRRDKIAAGPKHGSEIHELARC